MAVKKKATTRRQLNRREIAQSVVRGLLDAVDEGTVSDAVAVGRIVGRIIKRHPFYSARQRADLQRDWLKVLREELNAREVGNRHEAPRRRQ